jgi:hypothetical protein
MLILKEQQKNRNIRNKPPLSQKNQKKSDMPRLRVLAWFSLARDFGNNV